MRQLKIPVKLVLFVLISVCVLSFGCSKGKHKEGSGKGPAPKGLAPKGQAVSKKQQKSVNRLILPYKFYKFKDHFMDDWSFLGIEKYDEQQIVISLKNKKTKEMMFVWLTRKSDGSPGMPQSKSFNITCIIENKGELNEQEKKVADKLVALIKKNDKGKISLKKQPADEGKGQTVNLRYKSSSRSSSWLDVYWKHIVWAGLLALFVILVIIRIFSRSKEQSADS